MRMYDSTFGWAFRQIIGKMLYLRYQIPSFDAFGGGGNISVIVLVVLQRLDVFEQLFADRLAWRALGNKKLAFPAF